MDAARQKLGGRLGRTESPPAPGRIVEVLEADGRRERGVTLFTELGRTDVLFDRGVVRRVDTAKLLASSAAVDNAHAQKGRADDKDLERLSIAVRRFHELVEGDPLVITQHDGANTRAVLREKCRFGALVERSDGAIVAVGFDRMAPLPEASS